MKVLYSFFISLIFFQSSIAQISFTNSSNLLGDAFLKSGVAMCVADMNGDGLDDIVRLDDTRHLKIEYQRADGQKFDHYDTGFSNNAQWSMCLADVDKNGYLDLFMGGAYNGLSIVFFDSMGIDTTIELPNTDIFLQGSNFVDINNDGEIDIYACHDEGLSHVYRNEGGGEFVYDTSLIATLSLDTLDDNSGNYGSIWTDYDADGDIDMYLSKCRSGVSEPLDGRRVNQLWENDGNNNYVDVTEAKGIRPLHQSWATDFADIDNDGDMDAFVINHNYQNDGGKGMFYENVDNNYVDITDGSGIVTELANWTTGIQAIFDDFNNDGFIDLLTTGLGPESNGSFVFMNNGDKTFTSIDAFPFATPNLHSAAVGDLNDDGFLDILAGFGTGFNSPTTRNDRLLINDGNDNNWVKVRLKGSTSNINGIGARLELYGPLGMQVREVRSGESYGIMNSLTTHFGVDTTTVIDSIIVHWPSGTRDVICAPDVNTTILLTENCRPNCEGFVTDVSKTICKGEVFSFGNMELETAGIYTMTFNSSLGCDSTVILDLDVTVINTNVIIVPELTTLTAIQEDASYQWNICTETGFEEISGAINHAYDPTQSGEYAVIINYEGCIDTSNCHEVFITSTIENSLSFNLEIFPNPLGDKLNLKMDKAKKSIQLEIYDAQGQQQLERNFENKSLIELNTSEFASGVYFLNLNIDGENATFKLIKN